MAVKLKFKDLKTSAFDRITEEGIYILEFDDLVQGVTTKGDTKYEMSHKIVNTSLKVNYDNYVLFNNKDEILAFGTSKLRKLIEATELKVEEITPVLLKTLLKGKRFKAKLVITDKGFPQINYADIYPLSYEEPAINEIVENTENSESEQPATEEVTETIDIDTTDI